MRSNDEIKKEADEVFIGNYGRYPVAMVKGDGCRLEDADGREYIDFLAGIAVCSLGHCNPEVTKAVAEQVQKLVHVSNLYYTEPQTELARLLVDNSFADKVFMANSGAEANEAAIKLARIASGEGKYEIITLESSFHGRTLATVAATGQPKFHEGFEPIPAGFAYAPFGDLQALEEMVSDKTCAIMCEPLQGEGGVRPLPKEYIQGIREICDRHDLLLIFDEIQTGMGRCGTLFAHEQFGVTPDIMTLAKALGNGLPIGVLLTGNDLAKALVPGTHASTFGGNPVACAAAVTVMKSMLGDGFLAGVREKGEYLQQKLEELAEKYPSVIKKVRGLGLLRGAVLTEEFRGEGGAIVNDMFGQGVLMNFAGGVTLRFAPPLIVTAADIDTVVEKLDLVLSEYAGRR